MKAKTDQRPTTAKARNEASEGMLDRLFAWLDTSLVHQAAGELARECHIALCEATCQRAQRMSRDDAADYLRSVAPNFLVAEVNMVLQRRRVRESLRLRILADATDQVVELVLKDLSRTKARRTNSKAA